MFLELGLGDFFTCEFFVLVELNAVSGHELVPDLTVFLFFELLLTLDVLQISLIVPLKYVEYR